MYRNVKFETQNKHKVQKDLRHYLFAFTLSFFFKKAYHILIIQSKNKGLGHETTQ